MKFSFTATIDKAGINPYVMVPLPISDQLKATKGYISIKGTIKKHPFQQTLVPIKKQGYRLYVNGPMLTGAAAKVGDKVKFIIEPDLAPKTIPMPVALEKQLMENKLMPAFNALSPSRQKEILKYLNFLKTREALDKNIEKVVNALNPTGIREPGIISKILER